MPIFIEWVCDSWVCHSLNNGKQADFNRQERGEMTHYTLKTSFCISRIERFWKNNNANLYYNIFKEI